MKMDRERGGGVEREAEKGISLRRDREMNMRVKALKKRSVGGGGDLRQRIKVGVKCRNN